MTPMVRRGLVGIIVLICTGLMATPSQGVSAPVILLLLLAVCDVLLGRATRRRASASDARVDQRQRRCATELWGAFIPSR
jgi:membrane protein implicated in regulation of membrane protease activity